jgi:hypothetical protein
MYFKQLPVHRTLIASIESISMFADQISREVCSRTQHPSYFSGITACTVATPATFDYTTIKNMSSSNDFTDPFNFKSPAGGYKENSLLRLSSSIETHFVPIVRGSPEWANFLS